MRACVSTRSCLCTCACSHVFQNQICQNQIRRMNEENKEIKRKLEEKTEKERELSAKIKDLSRKLDDTESKVGFCFKKWSTLFPV